MNEKGCESQSAGFIRDHMNIQVEFKSTYKMTDLFGKESMFSTNLFLKWGLVMSKLDFVAYNDNTDQPMHQHSLVNTCVICSLELATCCISMF